MTERGAVRFASVAAVGCGHPTKEGMAEDDRASPVTGHQLHSSAQMRLTHW